TYAGSQLVLYTDGAAVASTPFSGTVAASGNDVNLARGTYGTDWFGGSLDEAAVYGYAISAGQVANHYNAGVHPGSNLTGAPSQLTAGPHRIRIDYQNLSAPAQLSLQWTPPGGTTANVPAAALRPRLGLDTSSLDADIKTPQTRFRHPIPGPPTATPV